jgi:endonuclease/exonuclease/phosphatase family metal-dependent hydrolase
MKALLLTCFAMIWATSLANSTYAQTPLSLMSYNIRYDNPDDAPPWTERRPHMAAQIAFNDPDIFGVQEALLPMVGYLAQTLQVYDHYGVGRDDGADQGETTTLFYRRARFERLSTQTLWCSKTPDRPSKDTDADLPRTFTRLILRDRISGKVLDIRNAHFDHKGAQARENCAHQIMALAPAPDAFLIVMGDFNTGPDSAPYRILNASPLSDARTLSPIVFGPSGTFNGFDIRRTDGEAIDHIFVDRRLRVTRFGTLTDSFEGKVISDHFPLMTHIFLP